MHDMNAFTNGTATIAPASIQYTAGAATTSGLSAIIPGAGTLSATAPLAAQTATVTIGLGGTSTAIWNPALTITVPALVTAGTGTATITRSVA